MRLFALLFIAFALALSRTASADSQLTLLPNGRLFPITFADPREIRTALTFSGDKDIQAMLGSYLSIFSIAPEDKSWDFHFGLEGRGYFTMREEGGRFPLETVDGTIGVYTEYAQGPWAVQLRYTHVSAHLADGSTDVPIAYSRESLILRGGYSPSENLHVYLGLHRLVNTTPKVHKHAIQIGANYFLPFGTATTPFIASDLRWNEEAPTNPSFALQLGVALHRPDSVRRSFRLFYSYYTGSDVRGQYFLSPRTLHSFGLEIPL